MTESTFVAANVRPSKVYYNPPLRDGKFVPLYLQIWVTNECNLKCPFCSTFQRDAAEMLDLVDVIRISKLAVELGTKAILFSGGGEPTLHPDIDGFINRFYQLGMEVALVTNGTLLYRVKGLEHLTWCRVSCDDYRQFEGDYLKYFVERYPQVDWGLSYIVTGDFDRQNLARVLNFAHQYDITHVRVTVDLWNLDEIEVPDINDDLCIMRTPDRYQTQGAKNCWLSLVKPLIAADGKVYGCCEVLQFNDFSKDMALGHYSELREIVAGQRCFDGRKCSICNFNQYNLALAEIKSGEYDISSIPEPTRHLNFL